MKKTTKYLLIFVTVLIISACSKESANTFDCNLNKYSTNPVATIEIAGFGKMEYELFINKAPQSVSNFATLANDKFYDGLIFHRLDDDLGIIQGGDPDGNGTGGAGYNIVGEFKDNNHCNDKRNEEGTLAMARSQEPNSGSSQFYFNYKNNTRTFGSGYAVFGQIISGQDVLDKIAKVPTSIENNMPKPVNDLVIKSIRVDLKNQELPELEKIN